MTLPLPLSLPFGLELFPFQIDALQKLIHSEPCHLLCIAPTGSGKTRIIEALCCVENLRILVISPLQALSQQHLETLSQVSGEVSFDPSSSSRARIWIASPEMIEARPDRLKEFRPDLLVVDECHLCEEWGGSGFRPSFLKLPAILAEIPTVRRSLWLTATLSYADRNALVDRISSQVADPATSVSQLGKFDWPRGLQLRNLRIPPRDHLDFIETWFEQNGTESGIIFCQTRNQVERVHRYLSQSTRGSLRIEKYHAGLCQEERRGAEIRIRKTVVSAATAPPVWVIGTTAYGLGMDLPGFEFSIQLGTPRSIPELCQLAGRTARGGKPGLAMVIWHPEDHMSPHTVLEFLMSPDCHVRNLQTWFETGQWIDPRRPIRLLQGREIPTTLE